ncbi:cytochrome mitochondrial precursor [Grosmannia clavigera kw1407]|uniref:Cytochrome mitochondrial n=1 Tax=Grosmannia clavigera (strain kw1407 / UAMH 11150) TaxID=655863 RepID=F0XB99_GROCL|nr:cytochrome mitochondrial precursor [Grosmannia clavigera kw1407]EFX04867.1 cytochrome mitochondrial precursor [Grosmannia clavigera kw1407]
MRFTTSAVALLATGALAARPFLDEPDTGISDVMGGLAKGQLPPLARMVALNDFQFAARNYLPVVNYTYYRNGAGGEWSYRNNLEVYNRYRFVPHTVVDITSIANSMNTTILGHNISSPLFISPCARAGYGHPDAELNLVRAAAANDIAYIISGYATLPLPQIAAAATKDQLLFSQIYFNNNDTYNTEHIHLAEAAGAKAIVWSVDSPGSPSRQRAARYDVGSANTVFFKNTWERYTQLQAQTSLPIVLKGIMSAADARSAINHGVKAIILSNHGGRNLDGSPSSLEVALEIHNNDPSVFQDVEVLADGGIRYGTDALRLLSLGVKAVGIGRPIMFSNVFGEQGVTKAVGLLKNELLNDAANLGVADIKAINASYVQWTPNNWYS